MSASPPGPDGERAFEHSPSFPPPDSSRIAGEWAEYSEPGSSAPGSVPPPRTSGFIRARRPAADLGQGEFALLSSLPRFASRQRSWALALGPGVLLVAASVALAFFEKREVLVPFETVQAGALSSHPPLWVAATMGCLGLVSIVLGARRFARNRAL